MTPNQSSTAWHFLRQQVFRSDYLIVDEQLGHRRTRLPFEHKLECLHKLCSSKGYTSKFHCERIRRQLYSQGNPGEYPVSLLLVEAYMPQCVTTLSLTSDPLSQRSQEALNALILSLQNEQFALHKDHCRSTWLDWNDRRYCLYLPETVHSLLIDRDSALLAA